MEAKELGDRMALCVVLILAHRSQCRRGSRKVPCQNKGDIVRRHRLPGEVEEGLFGFEIPELQQAIDLFRKSFAFLDEGSFGIRQGKILSPLEIVEVGQAVQS